MLVSVQANASRFWPPALTGAVSTAVATVGINFVTDGRAGWWWIVVALGVLGLAAASVWGYVLQRADGPAAPSTGQAAQQAAGITQQTANGNGINASFHAEDHSAAAGVIGTVNLGELPRNPTTGA